MASIPPSQTIYIRNLNDKIQKELLKRTLYEACVVYGRILDIVALKTLKMRGQAFVVFEDIASATIALRQLNGRQVFGQAVQVEYALSKSDVVAQQDGTFKYGEERKHVSAAQRKRLLGIAEGGGLTKRRPEEESEERASKRQAVEDDESSGDEVVGPVPPKPATVNEDEPMPNRTLFVSNIPGNVSAEMLGGLFRQYAGFEEVRQVAGKSDIAFVDYESIDSASAAREVLDGFKLSADQAMKIEFSR
ncbi:U2 small nuclear ribonucleoprotein B'' [Coemansia spiralis]|uniref:U2 small nuclear ribonucleoprotein B n=2 Tax=Coemansia TaxID=4863 RepID=A0A9W8L1D1_9FUNG|nr:U2 small nuclear ribonucleoprotein B'' [Coemansia umbellata]KAJ2623081.1 U2 small nuclear ribonucleoprotein B'' [Coemansia sp. RSA 1358]KAJ2681087.1 U2 small nuclear ribonucleoprotein B'' [Coemansia spiralis]